MELIVRVPTFEEEQRRVENIRSRLRFFEEHGYDVALPDGPLAEVFVEADYLPGVDAIEKDRGIIEAAAKRMRDHVKEWHIAPPERVTVVLTKYGVGGSYDIESGRIVVMLKPDGTLLKPASHLVVHEMLHLASDRTLGTPFGLTHQQNERLVDLFCRDAFGDLLVDYRMQPMGDASMDEVLKGLPDIDVQQRLIQRFGERPNA